MIKFFRKIRQRRLTDNKFSKYLLYAIGEIVLVVIGILIALYINNWNESNSKNKVANNYINNIQLELNSDLRNFEQYKSLNENQINQINDLLIALINDNINNVNEEELIFKLMDAYRPYPFAPKTATYTDMVTSGKMEFIKTIDLRQKIISHYTFLEQTKSHIDRETDYNWNHFIPFFNNEGYYEWRNHPFLGIIDSTKIKKIKHFSLLDIDKSSTKFKAIENNLYYRKVILNVRIQNLEELMESTNILLNEIEDFYGSKH